MAAAGIYVPRVNFSCLLPLQEALQDQQVDLTHVPFNLLLLSWVSECVRFWVCRLRGESVSYSPLALPRPTGLQSQMSWKFILLVQDPWAGEPRVVFRPSLLGESCTIVLIFLIVV